MATQLSNFEPQSDILTNWVKNFPLSDATLANPRSSIAACDGEWFTLDATGKKVVRGADIATLGSAGAGGRATAKCWPYWSQMGATDVQAIKLAPLVWMGQWEFDTLLMDISLTIASGAPITAILQGVKVATISLTGVAGTRNYVGLVGHGGSGDTAPIAGYVTRLPASNGGKLRIRNYL